MVKYWKYVLVAVLMFLLGTATVVAAPDIRKFVISDASGERSADVSPENRLLVDATGEVSVSNFPASQQVSGEVYVSNLPAIQDVNVGNFPAVQDISGSIDITGNRLPDPATIVNLHALWLNDDTPDVCDAPGFGFTVPVDKTLLITDVIAIGQLLTTVYLWTEDGIILSLAFAPSPLSSNDRAVAAAHLTTPLVVNSGEKLCPRAVKTAPSGCWLRDAC